MPHYYTPIDVARALAKHTPRRLATVLQPAVGTGVLLEPLWHRLQSSASSVVCIDKDSRALKQLKAKFAPLRKAKLEIICTDFFNWSIQQSGLTKKQGFDCILMNPPFEGKRAKFVDL